MVVIGSSHRRRGKSPPGTVLIINLLGKGLTPRACMGDGGSIWWAPAVPYFFVRSFRYTASYRHGYLDFGSLSHIKRPWSWSVTCIMINYYLQSVVLTGFLFRLNDSILIKFLVFQGFFSRKAFIWINTCSPCGCFVRHLMWWFPATFCNAGTSHCFLAKKWSTDANSKQRIDPKLLHWLLRIVLLVSHNSFGADKIHFVSLEISGSLDWSAMSQIPPLANYFWVCFTVKQLLSSVQLFKCQFSSNSHGDTSQL